MPSQSKHLLFSSVLLLVTLPSLLSIFAEPAPANDNRSAPFFAVYRWGLNGMSRGYYDSYASWLNRAATWAEDFQPTDSWDNIEGGVWQLRPWRDWIQAKPGRRLILSVVILPSGWKGPARGIDAGIPVSLEEGAKGTYNKHFKKLAENLVKYQLGDTILRLGWEFNGGWYSYRAVKKEALFAEYWRQIVQTMRSVPGAENLKYCWNPTNNFVQTDARKCWPGDEYVDYVGVDIYDQCWLPDTYPIPPDATPEESQRRQEAAWKTWNWNKDRHGLAMWRDFAKEHGKPLVIPEWGVCSRKDGHGGNDDPAFIEKMYEFIQDPANNVYFHCYFDVNAGDGHHQLTSDGNTPTEFPQSAARFKDFFCLPGSPATKPTPPAMAQASTPLEASTYPASRSTVPTASPVATATPSANPSSPIPTPESGASVLKASAPINQLGTNLTGKRLLIALSSLFALLLLSYFIFKRR